MHTTLLLPVTVVQLIKLENSNLANDILHQQDLVNLVCIKHVDNNKYEIFKYINVLNSIIFIVVYMFDAD